MSKIIETAPTGAAAEVATDGSGVTVESPAGTVATAHVYEHGDEVVIEFSTASRGLSDTLRRTLVDRAFDHAAVRTGRPILVCVPRGDSEVLRQSRRHVQEDSAHVAGVTCLITGRVGRDGPARGRL